ncbi:MAG: N-acetylmuramoyl-L-alanine amidase [Candidatus Electryoneaceae bacterium]|nr:N-acetylmuramoyl-L-alanine amidase [Candidatus Electryoneaceae bacterium]
MRFKVVISAGHTKSKPGASYHGMSEYPEAVKVIELLRPLLEDAGLDVTVINNVRLSSKIGRINQDQPDIAVELHFNAEASGQASGAETLHGTLATSQTLATMIQKQIVECCGVKDRGIKMGYYRGDKENKLVAWLRKIKPPTAAVIVEPLFLSNPEDAALLKGKDAIHEKIAQAIATGIFDYLNFSTSKETE